jgi:hypothetical protein
LSLFLFAPSTFSLVPLQLTRGKKLKINMCT